jgi:hypothetical protein
VKWPRVRAWIVLIGLLSLLLWISYDVARTIIHAVVTRNWAYLETMAVGLAAWGVYEFLIYLYDNYAPSIFRDRPTTALHFREEPLVSETISISGKKFGRKLFFLGLAFVIVDDLVRRGMDVGGWRWSVVILVGVVGAWGLYVAAVYLYMKYASSILSDSSRNLPLSNCDAPHRDTSLKRRAEQAHSPDYACPARRFNVRCTLAETLLDELLRSEFRSLPPPESSADV